MRSRDSELEVRLLFPIDLRSDTVTKPCAAMRRAMAEAEVGDDVYGDDPTVLRLEEEAAGLLGKEAALYVTSGTQGNLTAILTHCGRGEGVVLGRETHILNFEGGGMACLGGVVPLAADDPSGLPGIPEMEAVLRPADNVHFVRARLVCFENTNNRRGGHASTPQEISERASWAHSRGLSVHIDGARLFNAAVALGVRAADLVRDADSVQICLSKGLGAPMGSLLCASRDFVARARFWRKRLGGGLRQVGVVAAAGLYALRNNIDRLAEDHENARRIGEILAEGGLEVSAAKRPTNMVYFKAKDVSSADRILEACRSKGVLFNKSAPDTFRLVTHLDVSAEAAREAASLIVGVSRS
ncbi:low-specificity L-threonine aldolase [Fretibacterium sp. OH1220_COT-178]|nr:low-specificity L-threonine aldolase [Fretibacterium sp. OH1220_COT-178]